MQTGLLGLSERIKLRKLLEFCYDILLKAEQNSRK